MDWDIVREWLDYHGHIRDDWDRIDVTEDGIYCEDTPENTFISVFTKFSGELVVFVGCLSPKLSVGGHTCIYVEDVWQVIDYLQDNLENMFEDLANKFFEEAIK